MKRENDKELKIGAAAAAVASKQDPRRPDSWRETIESIVVAFVLAFLFRTFEAEAFVIPTGSMAPTLYGQHRDVYCTKCGTRFAVGVASTGTDAEIRDGWIVPAYRSQFAICPNANCRYPNDVLDHEMFAGDRILVNKFPYEFADPQRWDVVVFKFPEQAKTNYIKRLAGLPGEELKIEGGDIKVRRLGSTEPYRIARKTPEKQRELQLVVYDNDYPARDLLQAGWPESWENEADAGWSPDAKARTFQIEPDAGDPGRDHWLRYTNYSPSADDWMGALAGNPLAGRAKPELVKDFYAYNGGIAVHEATGRKLSDLSAKDFRDSEQWVGDLTINATVDVLASQGELTFELVEGKRRYHCRVDLASGRGLFDYLHEQDYPAGEPIPVGEAFDTGLNKAGKHTVSFANVDDRLCFWVDDRLCSFFEFEPDGEQWNQPPAAPVFDTPLDRAPVGIAARGAKLRLAHLRIERDIFYRSEMGGGQSGHERTYKLRDDPDDVNDEFLMLGDNSPRSNDSRLWQTTHSVPRHLLIGKAFFVYWPHGVPFLNGGRGFAFGRYFEPNPRDGSEPNPPLPKFSVPFYPQVGRMHRIR